MLHSATRLSRSTFSSSSALTWTRTSSRSLSSTRRRFLQAQRNRAHTTLNVLHQDLEGLLDAHPSFSAAGPSTLPPRGPTPTSDPTTQLSNLHELQSDPCTIHINHVDFSLSVKDLSEAFSIFGPIRQTLIPTNPLTDSPLGYAFITFRTPEAAWSAAHQMNGKHLGIGKNPKRTLEVMMAKEAKEVREEVRNPRGKVLWLGNLWGIRREDVWDLVKPFGAEQVMMGIGWSGRDKGFAHVRFRNVEDATEALKALNGRKYMGQLVKADYAKENRDGAEALAMMRVHASDEIWVGNCWGTGVPEVFEAFKRFRPVHVRVGSWRDERARWHASLKFESMEDARRAMEGMRGKALVKEPVVIGYATRLKRWQEEKAWYGGRAGLRLGIEGQRGRWKGDVVEAKTIGSRHVRQRSRGYGLKRFSSSRNARSSISNRWRDRRRAMRGRGSREKNNQRQSRPRNSSTSILTRPRPTHRNLLQGFVQESHPSSPPSQKAELTPPASEGLRQVVQGGISSAVVNSASSPRHISPALDLLERVS